MESLAFWLYILFTISWFSHLTGRVPALGAARFDLLLVGALFVLYFLISKDKNNEIKSSEVNKALKYLIIYSILTIPFVQWPGSVIRYGIPNFVKAVVFYFFTVKFIKTEKQLKIFIAVFLAVQSFRVLEPLYLHVTQGYWGSRASMANWEFMNRLSGAPHDIVNPNGLAFIIDSVIPFLYFFVSTNILIAIIGTSVGIASLYALILTGSRSGFLGLLIIVAMIFYKSKKKVLLGSLVILMGIAAFSVMTPDQKDRYLSIIDKHTENAATAEGRIQGIKRNFMVALRRPFFGHGIGTSREANANFANNDQPAHNLYTEVSEELGFLGLVIFLFYVKAVIVGAVDARKSVENILIGGSFLKNLANGMEIWFIMNLFFSMASYGLSSYEWYLFPGLVTVLLRLQSNCKTEVVEINHAGGPFA